LASTKYHYLASFVSLLVLVLSWLPLDKGWAESVKICGPSFSQHYSVSSQEWDTHFKNIVKNLRVKLMAIWFETLLEKFYNGLFNSGGADCALRWNPCSYCLVWHGLGLDDLLCMQMTIATMRARTRSLRQTQIGYQLGIKCLTSMSSKTWWDAVLAVMTSKCFLTTASWMSLYFVPWIRWADSGQLDGSNSHSNLSVSGASDRLKLSYVVWLISYVLQPSGKDILAVVLTLSKKCVPF
jgi:hypothetical protein